jgi:nucleotide-binding universal stress UspA family protein
MTNCESFTYIQLSNDHKASGCRTTGQNADAKKHALMKNFIVPIDFSSESLNGLKMAILFSQKAQVHIHMVNIIQKVAENDKKAYDAEYHQAEAKFREIADNFKPMLGNGSTLNYTIGKGRVYQEVVNQAQLYTDPVITASTHGASGFQELFIGSNTFRIISATDKPVIALRKNSCPEEIVRIVLPIDISADSRQKVPFTTELARLFGAEIHVVGIQSSRNLVTRHKIRTYVSQVCGYIQGKTTCESNEVFGDNVPDLIVNYASTVKANLISIMTERSSGLSLLIGNTAHQILNKAEIPVLCITPKNIRKSGTFVTTGG